MAPGASFHRLGHSEIAEFSAASYDKTSAKFGTHGRTFPRFEELLMGLQKRAVFFCGLFLFGSLLAGSWLLAEETEPSNPKAADSKIQLPSDSPLSVQQLAKIAEKAVVEITVTGRRGDRVGLGTGFVIEPDGLIATNLHVIAEARPITVRTSKGDSYPAQVVHASDRKLDLALLKI